MQDRTKSTQAQIDYATDLILKLGYDLDWYDLEKMAQIDYATDLILKSGYDLDWYDLETVH